MYFGQFENTEYFNRLGEVRNIWWHFCSHGVTSSLRQLITNVKTQLQALLVSDVKIVGFTDNLHLTTEVFSSMKVKRWMRVETARPCRGDRSV